MMATSRAVLVTGAGGFIGRYLCRELLAQGVAVRGLVRSTRCEDGVEPAPVAGLGDAEGLARALRGVDTVVHLAARVHVTEPPGDAALAAFRETNVAGTRSLLEAAIAAGAKHFVFVSSVKAAGERSDRPLTEDMEPVPADPYGVSKLEAERVVRELADAHDVSAPILRLPLVYGPGVKANMLRMFDLVYRGVPLPIGAANRRSMIYVGNVVAAIDAVLASPAAGREVFFVSDQEHLSTADLAHRIARALARPVRILPIPTRLVRDIARIASRSGKHTRFPRVVGALQRVTESLVVSNDKITRVAAYAPPFSVDEGLRRTAAWYLASRGGVA
jgi:nucleoside-diphosphate-sugar epimerase